MSTVRVDLGRLARRIEGAAERLRNAPQADWQMLYERLLPLLRHRVRQRFLLSQDPSGKPWPKLKRSQPGRLPLIKTGALLNALSGYGQGALAEVRGKTLSYGTNVPYAAFHQRGTKTIPRRKFLADRGEDIPVILAVLRVWLMGLIQRELTGQTQDEDARSSV
jgi:phage gpG-like protein